MIYCSREESFVVLKCDILVKDLGNLVRDLGGVKFSKCLFIFFVLVEMLKCLF